MTTPTTSTGRTAGPRWFFFVAAGCAAVAAVIAIVVFVVVGDDGEGQAAAAGSSESTEDMDADYGDLEMPTIPYTEVQAWSTERTRMQGELPEGTTYHSASGNPSWVTVNKFNGMVTYEPKQAGIQLRPYDITVAATLPNGESLNIETTVEVTKAESVDDTPAVEPPVLPRTTVSPGDSVTVALEGPRLPEGTTYIDSTGPMWMNVDKDTGAVRFNLDETIADYPEGVRDIMLTAWTPAGEVVNIKSEVEVVAGP